MDFLLFICVTIVDSVRMHVKTDLLQISNQQEGKTDVVLLFKANQIVHRIVIKTERNANKTFYLLRYLLVI